MDSTRRGFFKMLLSAAAVGATANMVIPKSVLADPVLNKYARTVLMQKELYGFNRKIQEIAKLQGHSAFGLYYSNNEKHFHETVERCLVNNIAIPADVNFQNAHGNSQFIWNNADDLLEFMMANYELPSSDPEIFKQQRQLTRDLFDRKLDIDVMSEISLREVSEFIVPIAVAKHMIAVERLPLNTQIMKQFTLFAYHYKSVIMS